MKEILKLDHIQKYYGNCGNVTKAIQDISFSVQEGEFVGIMGASGSGKTTLLNCISTIDTVSAGHIYLDGTDAVSYTHLVLAKCFGHRPVNLVSVHDCREDILFTANNLHSGFIGLSLIHISLWAASAWRSMYPP